MGVPESMFPDKLPAEKQLFSENIQLCKFYYSFLSKNSSVSHQRVYEKAFFHNFPGKTFSPSIHLSGIHCETFMEEALRCESRPRDEWSMVPP